MEEEEDEKENTVTEMRTMSLGLRVAQHLYGHIQWRYIPGVERERERERGREREGERERERERDRDLCGHINSRYILQAATASMPL